MFKLIGKLYFKISGWKIIGSFDNAPPKFIVIVMPHTANFDFILGVLARAQLNIRNSKYLGKSQLFRPPFGFIFRWLGGYPVDRSRDNNLVDAVVRIFNEKSEFAIALAPEGTRSKVDRLKTGFYQIAKKANIPIIPVAFDYSTRTIIIGDEFWPTDNIKEDFRYLINYFAQYKGKYPELGIDPSLYEKMVPFL